MALTLATKMELTKMLEATSHVLAVEDFDDVLRLDAVNRRIEAGEDCAESIAAPRSVRVGNLLLKRPCIGAVEWYEARAEWFADNAAISDCAFVFASVARHPGALWRLTDRSRARRAVKRFMRGMACTSEDLQAAFARLFGIVENAVEITSAPPANEVRASVATIAAADKTNHEATYNAIKHEGARLASLCKREKANYGPLIAMLCREYGGTPSGWKWNTPIEMVESCTKDFEMRMDAQEAELSKASGKKAPPKRTTRNLLIKEARLIGNEMQARWEATDGA